MATLKFDGKSYSVDHAVKGTDYVHGYDANGNCIINIEGVSDFSIITYDGNYLDPANCLTESCNDLKYCSGAVKTRDGRSVPASAVGAATANHNHDITTLDGYAERIIDVTVSRAANTFLAAPNDKSGGSSFRKLVAADLPTVPITKGGTGATSASDALVKLGAVAKTALKDLAYNATDANGDITVNLTSKYPATPGVYRVGAPFTGLPINIVGYGSLVIFNAGEYYLHLYKDGGGGLFHARTDNTITPTQASWRGIGGGIAWSNASPGSGFGAQTWQTDLSVWTYTAIKFAFHSSLCSDDQYTWWECCPIGLSGTANFTSLGGDGHPVSVRRKYSVSKTGISFGNGGYHQGTTNNLNDNTRAIPMEIYVW